MTRRLSFLSGLTACLVLSSCAMQSLPDATAMDRFYQHVTELNKDRIRDLEQRRASGKIDNYTYQQEKAALDAEIGKKAMDLAWTQHDLEETQRESLGLPTPDHPQDISVPEAGGLPTGGGYRRFNDGDLGLGGGGDSKEAMRRAAIGSLPGNNTRR